MRTGTTATQLERDRPEHRAHRIERVLSALEDRAIYRHAVSGVTPAPLECAIDDFRIELGRQAAALRASLGDPQARASPRAPNRAGGSRGAS